MNLNFARRFPLRWWLEGLALALAAVDAWGAGNSAPRKFTPPGDGDWALVLDDAAGQLPAPGAKPAEGN
jgi:hypothetical protein